MKSILISIKPKWVAKILNGEKTIEIRKAMPNCHLPIDVYIYCTKSNYFGYISKRYAGKIVAKFTLNTVEEIIEDKAIGVPYFTTQSLLERCLCKKSCLTPYDFDDYLNHKTGYAIHISDLEIFDKPKEISEFRKLNCDSKCPYIGGGCDYCSHLRLTRPPQNFAYIEVEE